MVIIITYCQIAQFSLPSKALMIFIFTSYCSIIRPTKGFFPIWYSVPIVVDFDFSMCMSIVQSITVLFFFLMISKYSFLQTLSVDFYLNITFNIKIHDSDRSYSTYYVLFCFFFLLQFIYLFVIFGNHLKSPIFWDTFCR